jgi:hypothetical protein
MEEGAGGWSRLRSEEFHNLYTSSNISRVIKSRRITLAGHVAWLRKTGNAYSILVWKCEGKRPLGRPEHRWNNNIIACLREIRW